MQDFGLYFELGWQHIADLQGYDHILFVTVLCGTYLFNDWKKLLTLITAFTLGHSLTLALSVLNILKISSSLIEFLIPVTICITAVLNVIKKESGQRNMILNYSLALSFGLIHGLGFSNYLKSLLGKDENIIAQLFAFNIGLEFGQLLIVAVVLIISYLFVGVLKVKRGKWNHFLSVIIFGVAFVMVIQRFDAIFRT